MRSDEKDLVIHGTSIEREEEIASQKKKSVAGASGYLRTLPAWKQDVTDEEGRSRFHGAFTGEYSDEYDNTVGSKEGWAPQSFTSSRKNRAEARKQSISDFLDEDERAEFEVKSLSASSQFDTFGFTAAEYARKQAKKEPHDRPSSPIPGPVPDELVAPVSESVDLPDPVMGKFPPAPRGRDQIDSLIFLTETEKAASGSGASLFTRQVSESQDFKEEKSVEEVPEVEVEVENVERPVDLYKAIFSDDSEEDEDQSMNGKKQEGQEKTNDAAATTLNRLIAGDFLESIGKELGLEVPSDVTYPEGTKPVEEDSKFKSNPEGSSQKGPDRFGLKENTVEKTSSLTLRSAEENNGKNREKSPRKRSGGNGVSSSESSGDERKKKRYKKDRHRNNDSESDSSSDCCNRDKRSSRPRRKQRESSKERRSSHKKHSKYHRIKKSSSSR